MIPWLSGRFYSRATVPDSEPPHWVNDSPPEQIDRDTMDNYRHNTGTLTRREMRDLALIWGVTVAAFTFTILAVRFVYR